MNIAFIGCGFVADFYISSSKYYPDINIVGAYDKDAERLAHFTKYYNIEKFNTINDILESDIDIIINLTNPDQHYDITLQALRAGKNVYSEKPLAMDYDKARELVELSRKLKLKLGSAPCSALCETSKTIFNILNKNIIGDVLIVYANFDAGLTHKFSLDKWKSESGALWPVKDEFETGCTYEHAGYFLSWLAVFFGPAKKITSFSSVQIKDKGVKVDYSTPDFSVGCIEYQQNIVARVTCSIIAPHDRSLTIIGSEGTIYVKDIRDDACSVYISKTPPDRIIGAIEFRIDYWGKKLEKLLNWIPWSWGNFWRLKSKYPFSHKPRKSSSGKFKPVDFCRGINDMAQGIKENKESILSADFALHITELTEALQYPEKFGGTKVLKSSFKKITNLN